MDVRGYVVHHDVQHGISLLCLLILLVFFRTLRLFVRALFLLIDEVCMPHPDYVLMVHLFMDLQLTILVVFVLTDLLHGDHLACRLQGAHVDFGEGANSAFDLR